MTSINTNVAAMTALQTLQSTNSALESTQNRISTGYRVSDAKDNAAYWSIATTMRSDNMAMSAVKDSLGIGAATVDTAYTGLEAAKDVLNEIKAKLTAATQDGVDRSKIQDEISQLKQQLKSIASSASFSGQNWLSSDSSPADYTADKDIVANFARSASGSLSLGTISVDTSKVMLYDASTAAGAGGILNGQVKLTKSDGTELKVGGNPSAGAGLSAEGVSGTETATAGVDAAAATAGTLTTAAIDLSGLDATDLVRLNFDIDAGATGPVDVAVGADLNEFVANLTTALGTAGSAVVGAGADAGKIIFTSNTSGAASKIDITAVSYFESDGTTTAVPTVATGLTVATGTVGADAVTAAEATTTTGSAFAGPMTLDEDDSISFDVAINGGSAQTITITKATVEDALATDGLYTAESGTITDAEQYAKVLTQALSDAGISGYTVAKGTDDVMTFTADTAGEGSISVTNGVASGGANTISVDKIDITQLSTLSGNDQKEVIKAFISVVDQAIGKVTEGASTLGAIQNRIDMQTQFVSNLMDTIDKGIGTLVDADMTEESTRLKALQTQQQLGVQALSIANNSTQSILQLFQN